MDPAPPASLSALRASRHEPLLRAHGRARHPLLLPRLGLRCRRHVPRPAARTRWRTRARHYFQPYYPVEERYGLIFAYMGRRKSSPCCRATTAWNTSPRTKRSSSMRQAAAPAARRSATSTVPALRKRHGPISRGRAARQLFGDAIRTRHGYDAGSHYAYTPRGIKSQQVRTMSDGARCAVTELALPTGRIVPSPTLSIFGPVTGLAS